MDIYTVKNCLTRPVGCIIDVAKICNIVMMKLGGNVNVRDDADKSLARSTSRCRRTESIVSLERGVCSCAELQIFSCYRG